MVNYLSLRCISSDVPGYTCLLPVHINCIAKDYSLFKLFVMILKVLSYSIYLYQFDPRYKTVLSLFQLEILFLRSDFPFIFILVGANIQKAKSRDS
jgi:hypothetical protein